MTLNEIRTDLVQIRYYYANKEVLEKAVSNTGDPLFMARIEKYNEAIRHAQPREYCLYVNLYMENNTQESLAVKWGYSTDNIQHLNNKLLRFFQKYFAENA